MFVRCQKYILCLWVFFVNSPGTAESLDNTIFTTLTTLRRGDCYVSVIWEFHIIHTVATD